MRSFAVAAAGRAGGGGLKFALVNPHWSFEGSTYFGCAEPHFPIELLSAREMLRAAGHEVLLVDAWMDGLTIEQVTRAARWVWRGLSGDTDGAFLSCSGGVLSRSCGCRGSGLRGLGRSFKEGCDWAAWICNSSGYDLRKRARMWCCGGSRTRRCRSLTSAAVGDGCRVLLAR